LSVVFYRCESYEALLSGGEFDHLRFFLLRP
jgi:hypothetical protein